MAFFSCSKDDSKVVVKGKVRETGNAKAVEGVTVRLDHKPVSSSIYTSGFQILATDITKADGTYKLEFTKTRSSDYRVRLNKKGYFTVENEYPPAQFETNSDIYLDFFVYPEAFVRTQIQNVSSYNEQDHIAFRFLDLRAQCKDCCPSGYIHGYGRYYDTTFVCATAGEAYLTYEYSVTMNQTTVLHGPDSVFVAAFDTVDLNITY